MAPNLLVLGGTSEASALCQHLAQTGWQGTLSLAGRVKRPRAQPLPTRLGGFGGVAGLINYLTDHAITHVIDATHPFAAQMSTHAVAACQQTGVPLIALTRPPWTVQPGDQWHHVPDIAGAVDALDRAPARVLLAVGRMHLDAFAVNPRHFYLLRLVDPPATPLKFPDCQVIVDRGPFSEAGDTRLLRDHRIDLVVSKNAGGSGAIAKITAARHLGLPVIMIDRPALPDRPQAHSVAEVMQWLGHETGTERGV